MYSKYITYALEVYMVKIGIIVGSTRPGRFGIQPANWLKTLTETRQDATFELIDLAAVNLPLLDEAIPASMATEYANDHTKKWSAIVNDMDGFVFVTPEYNHSTSGVLKNAIDYVYKEWNYKPLSFISYGSAAGGSRAVEHLRTIAAELKMFDIREQVMLHGYWAQLNEEGKYQFNEEQRQAATTMLDQLVFWATEMAPARAKLVTQ